ncbi:MAG: glycosyltransferase family 39 protein [archaeon]
MRNIIKNLFYLLLAIYVIVIVFVAFGFLANYVLWLELMGVVLALLGVLILKNEEPQKLKMNKKLFYVLFALALIIIFCFRANSYYNNPIPLGYDTGIYKYVFENGLANNDKWIITGVTTEPLFLYTMHFLNNFIPTQFMLTWLLVILCMVLGISVYFVVSEYADKTTGLIALFIYAVSTVQFYTFAYMYYKNIIAMAMMLFAFYFLKRYEKSNRRMDLVAFIILGGLMGAVHRLTFYIFGLSYFIYAFTGPISKVKYDFVRLKVNVWAGVLILGITSMFYLGRYSESITMMFGPVLQGFVDTGKVSGTFIKFSLFQLVILTQLPLALLGLFSFIRKKEFNVLVIWFVLNVIIVYFQFFFYNRFTILLDLIITIMAAFGFSLIIRNKNILGLIFMIVLLLSAGFLVHKQVIKIGPQISAGALATIEQFNKIEPNALVMSISSQYSPWVLGYSSRRTIAPGLFDYDNSTRQQWFNFWQANNLSVMKDFMANYQKPVYIFVGAEQRDIFKDYKECFSIYYISTGKIYKYIC